MQTLFMNILWNVGCVGEMSDESNEENLRNGISKAIILIKKMDKETEMMYFWQEYLLNQKNHDLTWRDALALLGILYISKQQKIFTPNQQSYLHTAIYSNCPFFHDAMINGKYHEFLIGEYNKSSKYIKENISILKEEK